MPRAGGSGGALAAVAVEVEEVEETSSLMSTLTKNLASRNRLSLLQTGRSDAATSNEL